MKERGMVLAARDWLAGDELGNRFDDVRLLHAGSRFTIYESREISTNRAVVIKVPTESSATWLYDVLDHEATVLAAAGGHPNVVTMYQRVRLYDGRPALLLERCTSSLTDTLGSGGQVPVQESVAIGIKIAAALETVHQAGYLHCDVRPNNVLVSEWGEPVLAGFDESVDLDATTVRAPLHVTTAHTAPELLEGAQPSPRSDVYGLGSTLYELVAGRAAFRAYADESAAAVIIRVLSGNAKPVFAPDVPLELSDLVTWAMAPDPAERPPSPAWLAEELGRLERRQSWPHTRMVG